MWQAAHASATVAASPLRRGAQRLARGLCHTVCIVWGAAHMAGGTTRRHNAGGARRPAVSAHCTCDASTPAAATDAHSDGGNAATVMCTAGHTSAHTGAPARHLRCVTQCGCPRSRPVTWSGNCLRVPTAQPPCAPRAPAAIGPCGDAHVPRACCAPPWRTPTRMPSTRTHERPSVCR